MKPKKSLVLLAIAGFLVAAAVLVTMFAGDETPEPRPVQRTLRLVAVMERTAFQADAPTEAGQREALHARLQICTDPAWKCEVTVLLGEGDANAARVLADTRTLTVDLESEITSAKVWKLRTDDITADRKVLVNRFVEEIIDDLVASPVSKGCTNLLGSMRSALSTFENSGDVDRRDLVLMASGNSNCPPVVLVDGAGNQLTTAQATEAVKAVVREDAGDGIRLGFEGFGRTFLSEGREMTIGERESFNVLWRALAEFWGLALDRDPIDGGSR